MTAQARGTLAAAIVSYNTRDLVRACLASLLPESPRELIIVDNASTDGTAECVRREFPTVRLIANRTNPGYGAGANQALAASTADYVLVLNSDTRVRPGALGALTSYLDDNTGVGIAGPRLENADGSLQSSCYAFPTPLHLFLEESTLGRGVRWLPLLRERYWRTWPHNRAVPVPWVLGAALAIRREAWRAVGGFEEPFFLYMEETDLCYRMEAAGWAIHFTPSASIVHLGGASTGQRRADSLRRFYASANLFYARHYGPRRRFALRGLVLALVLGRWSADRLRSLAPDAADRQRLAENLSAYPRIARDALRGWK